MTSETYQADCSCLIDFLSQPGILDKNDLEEVNKMERRCHPFPEIINIIGEIKRLIGSQSEIKRKIDMQLYQQKWRPALRKILKRLLDE